VVTGAATPCVSPTLSPSRLFFCVCQGHRPLSPASGYAQLRAPHHIAARAGMRLRSCTRQHLTPGAPAPAYGPRRGAAGRWTRNELDNEWPGLERDRMACVEAGSFGNREVTGEERATTDADGALNTGALDDGLDRARPVPAVIDAVEAALAKALERTTATGRFDAVAQLVTEIEARRLARSLWKEHGTRTLPAKT